MEKRFIWWAKMTLLAIYLVMLAGSVVRMTGSGMGCPDWPRCFGQWVPPTQVSELPENYKELYAAQRAEKVEKFCGYLDRLGLEKEAEAIRHDPTLLEEQDFNAAKTWTEYVNRLIGFLAGNMVLIMTLWALFFYRRLRRVFFLSLLNLILISLTAWFGAIVVATNLMPWIITVHVCLALLIVVVQIRLIYKAERPKYRFDVSFLFIWMLRVAVLLSFAQIIMGTQVRQEIDVINDLSGGAGREGWVEQLGLIYWVHRSFSIVVLLVNAYLFYRNWRYRLGINLLNLLMLLLLAEILTGVGLGYLGFPGWLQPLHLMLASLILGLQVHILCRVRRSRRVLY